jgi:hypothetical protein
MALALLIPAAPTDTLATINAAIRAINNISALLADEINGRGANDVTISRALDQVGTSLANLRQQVTELTNGFNNAQASDGANDRAISAALDGVARALNALTLRVDAVEGREASFMSEIDTISDAIDALTKIFITGVEMLDRPGFSPQAFTFSVSPVSLSGLYPNLPAVPSGMVVEGDSGLAVRVIGSGRIAMRGLVAVESTHVYRPRALLQRRANPSDPSNDSVVFGITWLDQRGNDLPNVGETIIQDLQALTTADGQQDLQALFSRAPGPGLRQAPSGARYARAWVRTYGPDAITEIQVLGIDDVSNATILAPETASIVSRVGALESIDAGDRLNVIEGQLSAPNSITFPSKSDAAAGMIPETVTTVELRGRTTPGDGEWALYVRQTSAPAGSDSFTNAASGAIFVRVLPSEALIRSWLEKAMGPYLASLPKTEQEPGKPFLNGGNLALS